MQTLAAAAVGHGPDAGRPLHVLWVNDHGAFTGGAERYVHHTASLLAGRAVGSSLLYDVGTPLDPTFARAFGCGAFPMVDLARQVAALQPDVVYVHRLGGRQRLRELKQCGVPVVRFFHDHQLFCLREHKYTGFSHDTCTRSVGLSCYLCPGFLHRGPDRSLRVRTLSSLEAEQADNRTLDAFVVGSSYMADQIAAHGFPTQRINVLPLFGEVQPPPTSRLPRERDLLLFVGQLVRGKGLDVLLRALSLTRHPARLAIAGSGAQADELRALASSLRLDGRVSFLGSLEPAALEALYAGAVALVVPSRSPETFGLVGLEAMRRGLPVVASRVGGMGEWLVDGETGLGFPSGDAMALATAIDWLLDHPDEATAMGRAGRLRANTCFSASRHLDGLVGLFGGLAGRLVQ